MVTGLLFYTRIAVDTLVNGAGGLRAHRNRRDFTRAPLIFMKTLPMSSLYTVPIAQPSTFFARAPEDGRGSVLVSW